MDNADKYNIIESFVSKENFPDFIDVLCETYFRKEVDIANSVTGYRDGDPTYTRRDLSHFFVRKLRELRQGQDVCNQVKGKFAQEQKRTEIAKKRLQS